MRIFRGLFNICCGVIQEMKIHEKFFSGKTNRRLQRGILSIGSILFVLSAHAAQSSDCGTPAQITERLKAEGQRSFAMADQIKRENDLNTLYGMVFTVNGDFTVGYILQSDQPTEE